MIKEINICDNVLRNIKDNYKFYQMYFLPCSKEERLTWFLGCLCEESNFLNSGKKYHFQEEIGLLADLCDFNLSIKQINILSDLIGNFKHQFKSPVAVEKLYALDDIFILELVNLLIKGDAYFDTHIAVRADLVFYESVHSILPYDKYKELVFKTICRTTTCSTGDFNPMDKTKCKVWLKDDDYKQLCAEIFK